MPRRTVERSPGFIPLKPTAAPVDTFVNPGPNRMADVAEALQGLSGTLRGVLGGRQAAADEEAALRGQLDFVKNNGQGLAEAQRGGLLPSFQNDAYVEGWKQSEGESLGYRLDQEFQQAYQQWADKDTADAESFGAFYSDFTKKFLADKDGDPRILKGLVPILESSQRRAYEAHTEYRNKVVYEAGIRSALSAANGEIAEVFREGKLRPEGTDYEKVWAAVTKKRDFVISKGATEADVDAAVMKDIAQYAIIHNDTGLLSDFFGRKVPGKDFTYGETSEGLKLVAATTETIENNLAQQEASQRGAEERREKEAKEQAMREANEAFSQDPLYTPDEATLVKWRKAWPTVDKDLKDWRNTFASNSPSDPEALKRVDDEILAGGGLDAVRRANEAGVFKNGEDLKKAYAFAEKVEGSGKKVDEIMGRPSAKSIIDTIEKRTESVDMWGNRTPITDEGLEAKYDLQRYLIEWAAENPNATVLQQEEAVAKYGKLILDRIAPSEDPLGGGGTYDRPKGEAGDNAFSGEKGSQEQPAGPPQFSIDPTSGQQPGQGEQPQQPQGQQPAAPTNLDQVAPTAPKAEAAPPPVDPKALMESFTPFQQNIVKKMAAETGMSVEDFLTEAYQPEAPATPPAEKMAYSPEAPLRSGPLQPGNPQFLSQFATGGATRKDSFTGMNPDFSGGLEAALKAAPPEVRAATRIFSGYRSIERQQQLWANALKKYGSPAAARKWVAPPGRSGHNHGHAADLKFTSKAAREWWNSNAKQYGLAFPLGNEPWHVELASARAGGGGRGFKVPPQGGMAALVNRGAEGQSDTLAFGSESFTAEDAQGYLDAVLQMPDNDNDLDYEDSARTGDARTDRLLNLIGQGESGNNYNAVFGNGESKEDLSKLTLDDIIAQQTQAVARGVPSTAIGKYQFLRKTLLGLKQELGLTGKEAFTPKLQDTLALSLLERRGYEQWKAGKLSTRQFARRLSQEWAALPEPTTGRSYYGGDGLNKARVKPRDVYAALGLTT